MKNRLSDSKPKYLDASIPLCVLTQEPKEHFERCLKIMDKIEKGNEKVITSVFTIVEIGFILERREGINKGKVAEVLEALIDCLGLKLVDVEAALCREAIRLRLKYGVDFIDAYNVLTMKKRGIKEIYSLDRHYDIFKEIRRI